MPRRTGFTLYEVILVMGIVMLMAGLVAPSLGTFFSSFSARKSGDLIIAAAGKAHADAVLTMRRYRLCIVEAPRDGARPYSYLASETDPLRNPGVFRRLPGGWGDPEQLPDGVSFESLDGAVEDATLDARCYDFNADGTATAGAITLVHERGERLVITIDGTTGAVAVEDAEAEATAP